MASGGLILSCIRVLENDEAQAVNVAKRGKKRAAAATAAAATTSAVVAAGGPSEDKKAAAPVQANEGGEPAQKKVKVEADGQTSSGRRIPDVEGAADGMQIDGGGIEAP